MKRGMGWFLGLLLMPLTLSAADIPVRDFFRHAEFQEVELSPTGEYLAVTVPQDDRTLLAVLKTADKSIVAKWDYGARMHAYDVTWVNDERFFVNVAEKTGSFDGLVGDPNLYAANADGSRRLEVPLGGTYRIVDLLEDDPRTILVQRTVERPNLFRMDVYTGRLTKVAVAPVERGGFVVDREGQVRYAAGATVDGKSYQLYRREGDDWKLVFENAMYGGEGGVIYPVGFAPDNERIYMAFSRKGEPRGVLLLDPQAGKEEVLFQDRTVDFHRLIWSHDNRRLLGLAYMPDVSRNYYFDPKDKESALLAALDQAFQGQTVEVTSQTRDGRYALVRTSSDVDPGRFYLFDTHSKRATFLLANRSWIDPERMSPVKPIQVTTRDGLTIHGYLTLPRGSSGRNLPMVVYVHGGPMARDAWRWDSDAQFLASRGYAVLQMNYRGSSGYGEAFQRAGYRHWGTKMQDDLTDSVKWAIAQGIADPGRICIYGASYGGYAALMSPTREPDLYRCAIGYVGVYSLPLQTKKSDTSKVKSGRTYLHEAYPETLAEQQAQSPAYNVDKLKAAVMLVHGRKDERVPIAHMNFLIEQMAKVGKKPEIVIVEDKEAHGFFDVENNVNLYTEMEKFLDRHIGGRAAAAATQ